MDNIADRLKYFLQQNGIASSVFAGVCDIPRPTLSQLLNGRNKKVSNELIEKIHRGYPEINVMWLMFGDGYMYIHNRKSGELAGGTESRESSALDQPLGGGSEAVGGSRRIDFGDTEASLSAQRVGFGAQQEPVHTGMPRGGASNARVGQGAGLSFGVQYSAPSRAGQRGHTPAAADDTAPRTVVSITVFYNDGRFETFVPKN